MKLKNTQNYSIQLQKHINVLQIQEKLLIVKNMVILMVLQDSKLELPYLNLQYQKTIKDFY